MADTEALVNQLNECAEKQDFEGAFRLVRENRAELDKKIRATGIRDALKKTTRDRLLLSFLDGVGFGESPLDESLVKLEKLVGFQPGALVLSKAWGIGKVKRLDYFYKRITVDFKTKKGHQVTYAAACDMLEGAVRGDAQGAPRRLREGSPQELRRHDDRPPRGHLRAERLRQVRQLEEVLGRGEEGASPGQARRDSREARRSDPPQGVRRGLWRRLAHRVFARDRPEAHSRGSSRICLARPLQDRHRRR